MYESNSISRTDHTGGLPGHLPPGYMDITYPMIGHHAQETIIQLDVCVVVASQTTPKTDNQHLADYPESSLNGRETEPLR